MTSLNIIEIDENEVVVWLALGHYKIKKGEDYWSGLTTSPFKA